MNIQDIQCSIKIFETIKSFTKNIEGSCFPIHTASGMGFMRALAEEISKLVYLKKVEK